ncbi:exosome RNA helicase MTR4 [Vairimorpha necatrix]|uniref:Exosome RNA helicase MTR4 n=1 Tax=Vairimorpha necatrix TaxID=6039 RepID=A0AAX4JC95_9MICR
MVAENDKDFLKYFKSEIPSFTNITLQFTGIGHLVIHGNGLISYICTTYNLDIRTLPLHTIFHGFNFLISNLRSSGFEDISIFFDYTDLDCFSKICIEFIKSLFVCKQISELNDFIKNERVALVLGDSSLKSLDFLYKCAFKNLYVGVLDNLEIRIPFIYTFVFNPLSIRNNDEDIFNNYLLNENFKFSINKVKEKIQHEILNFSKSLDLQKIEEMFDFEMDDKIFSVNEKYLSVEFVELLYEFVVQSKQSQEDFIFKFDGRLLLGASTDINSVNLNNMLSTKNNTVSDNNKLNPTGLKKFIPEKVELDFLVSAKSLNEKSNLIHLKNIQKSAESLFNGKLLFAPIIKSKPSKISKISKKQQEIINQNKIRLEEKQKEQDNLWLRNFYIKYRNSDSQNKKFLLENVVTNNESIYKRILLLKIEYYSDIWNLEKRSEDCDEKKIVPCYLACLEYCEKYLDKNEETEFVLQKLIDCGFEATVHEIIETKLEKSSEDLNEESKEDLSEELEDDKEKTSSVDKAKTKKKTEDKKITKQDKIFKHNTKDINNEEYKLNLEFFTEDTSKPSDYDICFQLKYTGDKLKRNLGSKKDPRVLFEPDAWQRRLLDLVDENKSAIIAAPTSSGKTFICFYAIEKILRTSDKDMVIFCLPTKALANQVSADIYARFAPKLNVKTHIQGLLMKDFITNPYNCQVLITIPSLLESLLNSPPENLLPKIKYIIIDEVHKISSEEMGSPIERIIHLSPCPLLVLSATLGNLEGFYDWVSRIEKSKNRECELVSHSTRYADLKPFVYSEKIVPINNLFSYSYDHIKKFGFGNDINFLPEELLSLFDSLCLVLNQKQKELLYPLVPERFFKSNILTRKNIKEYQNYLLKYFEELIKNNELGEKQVKKIYKLQTKESKKAFENIPEYSESYILENINTLLDDLKDKDMLPCIIFNTDRDFINKMALKVYKNLETKDKEIKKDKEINKIKKEHKRTRDQEKSKDSWINESLEAEKNFEYKTDKKNIKFSYLDPMTKVTDYELEEETKYIKNTKHEFVDMFYRGIGVHHEQLNKKYRNVAEILFRHKHLRVLFATDTLALGINMPCRTVVFAGDSLLLDPLNFKQMAGRAGRRGFDTIGNVVFMGIPQRRVQNLMVSQLPNIKGVYTYTNTSFIGFDIKESLIKYPLLEQTFSHEEKEVSGGEQDMRNIEENIKGLSINKINYDLANIFTSEDLRRNLVDSQMKILEEYFHKESYLNDLIISNRDSDPPIFILALLLENNLVNLEPSVFMNTLSHLFEIRPLLLESEHVLPPLDSSVYAFIKNINNQSIISSSSLYSPVLKGLQMYSKRNIHTILSFLQVPCLDSPKNSYLLDFYNGKNVQKIVNENKIRSVDLFKSLSVIHCVLTSMMKWYNKYDGDSEMSRKLSIFYGIFDPKFKSIFA